jgi:hypothetical protein
MSKQTLSGSPFPGQPAKLVRMLVDLAAREENLLEKLIDNLSDALASGDAERIRAAATALVAKRRSSADPKVARIHPA